MAISHCNYDRAAFAASYDRRNLGTYRGSWIVETNGSNETPKAVLNAALSVTSPNDPIPALYDTYSYEGESDSYAYAQQFEIVPRERGSTSLWTINVTWSPLPEGKEENDFDTNPLLRGVEYAFDWEVYTEIVDKDKDDKQIVNTAGKPFDVNVEMERSRSVIVASYNVASFATVVQKSIKYQDAVNSVTWSLNGATIQPRYALCRNVQSSGLITEPGGSYYRLNFRVALNAQNWDEKLLSRGFGYLQVANDLDTYTTEDRNGVNLMDTLDEPILLKEDGTIKPKGDPPYYTEWRVREETSFANIFNYAAI